MLSMPPLLLALLAFVGQLGAIVGVDFSDRVAAAVLDWADGVFTTRTMTDVVRPLVVSTVREGNSGVLSLSILLSLWSGSSAVSNYLSAITLAYDLEGLRSFWRTRLLSLAVYLAGLIIGAVLLPALVLGPTILAGLLSRVPGPDLSWMVTAGYWPVVSLLSLVALTSLYHVAVPVRTRWHRDLPGAVLALLVWVGGSIGLRTYLGSGLHRDAGPVTAPIAVLIFFYLTAFAVLIGAELNATVDDAWPEDSTRQGRLDARDRRQ